MKDIRVWRQLAKKRKLLKKRINIQRRCTGSRSQSITTMKKKSRHPRSSETSQQSSRTQVTVSISEEKRTPGNRGRPRKTVPITTDSFYHDDAATDKTANLDFSVTAADDTAKHPESKSKSSGRLSTAICRLCHGKFSPRSLRHAFNRWSQDPIDIVDDESDAAAQSPLLFHTDFQRLVGVQLNRDPRTAAPTQIQSAPQSGVLGSPPREQGLPPPAPDLKEVLKGQCWGL
ncbi:zinc finger protein 276-like protein [Lates japonicus]|uniref:Zinc finger protein 276-like protein n=1 Tax=Lates japonicus TaxID=270547 RepID=A0AAD3RL41_LATJO|nr:zinc finger protein 276-like protein [Lates japonicus]